MDVWFVAYQPTAVVDARTLSFTVPPWPELNKLLLRIRMIPEGAKAVLQVIVPLFMEIRVFVTHIFSE